MALNAKQRVFVREYLKDRNAKRAYIASGYGKKNAETHGPRLARNGQVADAIQKGLARLEAKLDISAEKTLARIADFAFQPLTAKEMKNSAGINSLRAIEMLGKHFKMFIDVHELSGKDGGPFAFLQLPTNGTESPEFPSPASAETEQCNKPEDGESN